MIGRLDVKGCSINARMASMHLFIHDMPPLRSFMFYVKDVIMFIALMFTF